jgi:hypothetical protein
VGHTAALKVAAIEATWSGLRFSKKS